MGYNNTVYSQSQNSKVYKNRDQYYWTAGCEHRWCFDSTISPMPRKQAAPGRSGRQQKEKKKEEGKRARKRPGAPASSSAPTPSDSTGRIQTFMASEFYSEDGGDGGVEHAIADPWLEERVGELASVAGQLAHTTSLVVQIVASDPNILHNPMSKSPENGTNAVNCFFDRIMRAVARAATSRAPPEHPMLRRAFIGAPQPAEEAATALLNANEGRWREAVGGFAGRCGGGERERVERRWSGGIAVVSDDSRPS